MTEGFLPSINASLVYIATSADLLVSCVSLRGNSTSANSTDCPADSARELADDARAELDSQLVLAREGLQEYADVFEEYRTSVTAVYASLIVFYEGATSYFDTENIDISGLGSWADIQNTDLILDDVTLPDISGILTDYANVATASEIWEQTHQAYGNFSDSLASVVFTLAEALEASTAELLSNISFTLEDYDPPRYANGSSHVESDALLESTVSEFEKTSDTFNSQALALLDDIGPWAPNLSFPAAQLLNYTFGVSKSVAAFLSSVPYHFEEFEKKNVILDSLGVSATALALLLLTVDYLFRCSSSLRLMLQFWSGAGLGIPDADLMAEKPIFDEQGIVASFSTALLKIILHPITTVVFYSTVTAILVYQTTVLYLPWYYDYVAGCVDHTEEGSFLTRAANTFAYNYASDEGDIVTWAFQVRNNVFWCRRGRRNEGVCGRRGLSLVYSSTLHHLGMFSTLNVKLLLWGLGEPHIDTIVCCPSTGCTRPRILHMCCLRQRCFKEKDVFQVCESCVQLVCLGPASVVVYFVYYPICSDTAVILDLRVPALF